MTRRLSLLLPAFALALVLAGCFTLPLIATEEGDQDGALGRVVLHTEVCDYPIDFGVPEDGPACLSRDDMLDYFLDSGDSASIPHQILVAFRVPEGAKAPESLTVHDVEFVLPNIIATRSALRELKRGRDANLARLIDPEDPETVTDDVTFRRAPELGAEMLEFLQDCLCDPEEDLGDPLPAGSKFVGYISDVVPGAMLGGLDLDAAFGLPRDDDANPFGSPFKSQAFAGTRIAFTDDFLPRRRGIVEPDFDPERPIDCSENPEEALTLCPIPAPTAEGGVSSFAGIETPTQDLRVLPGEPVTVEAGQTATVPFTIRANGPASTERLDLLADVSAQDAKAAPANKAWAFAGTGEHVENVSVQVPHYTEPGEYRVRLLVNGNNGESRDAHGKLIVLPHVIPAAPPITVTPTITTPDNLYLRRGGGIWFGYICQALAADCGTSTAELYVDPAGLATARAAQVADTSALQLAGFSKFRAVADQRVEKQVRPFKKTRAALLRGRTLRGVLIIRSGEETQVRRVAVRAVRPR